MFIGIDVGATSTVLGGFEKNDPLDTGKRDIRTIPTSNHFPTDMKHIETELQRLRAVSPIEEIGIAAAGRVNNKREKLLYAGNLTGWVEKPLLSTIAKIAPDAKKIIVGNDAEAQALYEALNNPQLLGVDFIMWSVGTGIGTGRITWQEFEGKLAPICLPMEAQHAVYGSPSEYLNPEVCGCGLLNCTERLGGSDGAQQRFGKEPDDITAEEWDQVAKDQAVGLAGVLVNHLVDVVVFGGGVSLYQPQLQERVEHHLKEFAIKGIVPKFVPATCIKMEAAVSGLTLLRRGRIVGGKAPSQQPV